MYRIAVMGDKDSVYGFGALGLSVYPVSTPDEGRRQLHKLAREEVAVIYLTEALASQLEEDIRKYDGEPLPAIILIPGVSGNTGNGMKSVARSVERAVGSNLLEAEEEEKA